MEAAIYLRQSLDRNGNMLAVDRQREDCTALCEARGWAWTEYVDNDTSASNGKARPGYEAMLADIREGLVQGVVAWDADRLHRRPRELEDFIDLANQKNLTLATIGGDFDLSTPTGRGNARMRGVFARMEMEQKAARQKRAAKQRAEGGKANWATTPFGYRKAAGGLVLDPDQAAMVRDAYSAVLAGGTLHMIAKEWNAKGVLTARGKPWSGATVRQLLMSYRNAGLAVYMGEPVTDEDGEFVEGDWPPIVGKDILDGVRAILTQPGRRIGGTSSGRKHLLSGLARCGACGKTMGSGRSADDRGVYVCKHCHKVTRDMSRVDETVIGVVVERLSRPDAADLLVNTKREDIDQLRDRASALRARQDELASLFADQAITASQLKTGTAKLTTQLGDIEKKMFSTHKARVFDGLIGGDVAVTFAALPLDRKRAVIDTLVTVVIKPAGQFGRGFNPDSVDVIPK